MPIQLDHIFIACARGAPEAQVLLDAGFIEGSSNVHPGQGTANRRFFFENFMLELIWVTNQAEATNEQTRRTRLWERCSNRGPTISPFGLLFRVEGDPSPAPFPTWKYFPSYLPVGIAIDVAEGTTLDEPELFFLPFGRARQPSGEPRSHALPFNRIEAIAVGVSDMATLSDAALSLQQRGHVRYFQSAQALLTLQFKDATVAPIDFRPALPLVISGVTSGVPA